MSASLVGSEMCIRDRVTVKPSGDSIGLQTYLFIAPSRIQLVVRLPREVGCLLYTSDAADDM
eukprot:4876098-Alexandrium_andersonii.AAC.1